MAPFRYGAAKPYSPPRFQQGRSTQNSLVSLFGRNSAAASAGRQLQGYQPPTNPDDPWRHLPPNERPGPDGTWPPDPGQTPPGPGPGPGPGGGGGGGINWDADPILAQVRALNARMIAQAQAEELAGRKQAEIGFGYDPALKYEDPATTEAARQNPFSTLKQLLTQHDQRWDNTNEALNKSNLFYSGERGRQIGLEGKQYTLEQVMAHGSLQEKINALAKMVMDTRLGAQQREIDAEQSAYERALAYGGGGSGGGGSGGGGGGGNIEQSGTVAGYSDETVSAAAKAYAAAHGYPQAHMVMQEGHIEVRNGVNGVYVKYIDSNGQSTTEWTPLPAAGSGSSSSSSSSSPSSSPSSSSSSSTSSSSSSASPAVSPEEQAILDWIKQTYG